MMKSALTAIPLAVSVMCAGSPAWAAPLQDTATQQQSQVQMAEGELVRVDTDAKTIVIKTEDAKEAQFTYTADTEVTGAESGTAGLATSAGSHVTVHFKLDGESRTATKIEVHAKP